MVKQEAFRAWCCHESSRSPHGGGEGKTSEVDLRFLGDTCKRRPTRKKTMHHLIIKKKIAKRSVGKGLSLILNFEDSLKVPSKKAINTRSRNSVILPYLTER